jgi:hypothetical protein
LCLFASLNDMTIPLEEADTVLFGFKRIVLQLRG